MLHKTYCFDLDGTLFRTEGNNYEGSSPIFEMIRRVNYLHDQGCYVKLFTSRGMTKYEKDVKEIEEAYWDLTMNQLYDAGVKFDELIFGKPSFDVFLDDKNKTIDNFIKEVDPIVGIVAGAFDIIHPGYIKMFQEAKENCDQLIVALHIDPSLERGKPKPILSLNNRYDILNSIKFIDKIFTYKEENDLKYLLENLNIGVRFLGDDYEGKEYNFKELGIPVRFINRSHGWSTSKIKQMLTYGRSTV